MLNFVKPSYITSVLNFTRTTFFKDNILILALLLIFRGRETREGGKYYKAQGLGTRNLVFLKLNLLSIKTSLSREEFSSLLKISQYYKYFIYPEPLINHVYNN